VGSDSTRSALKVALMSFDSTRGLAVGPSECSAEQARPGARPRRCRCPTPARLTARALHGPCTTANSGSAAQTPRTRTGRWTRSSPNGRAIALPFELHPCWHAQWYP
jgi:hypothetical protein